ncbi:MAG: lipoprotein [Caulobacterales bacterium]
MKRLILAAAALSLLAGCGLQGSLERPPPMGGQAERAEQEAVTQQQRENERRAEQTPGVGGAGTSIPVPAN